MASRMLDHHPGGEVVVKGEAVLREHSCHVLHVDGLTRPKEGAVKNRMNYGAKGTLLFIIGVKAVGEPEAVRLYALVPARMNESRVAGYARKNEVALIDTGYRLYLAAIVEGVLVGAALGVGEPLGFRKGCIHVSYAIAIGLALPIELASTVANRNVCALHGLSLIEARHPYERRLTAPLEVRREVRHQGRGMDVHRSLFPEIGGAEDGAFQLHHVQSRSLERNPDHLERILTEGPRHGQSLCGRLPPEKGPRTADSGDFLEPLNDLLVAFHRLDRGGYVGRVSSVG